MSFEQVGRTALHEIAHFQLRAVNIDDPIVYAPLGRYDPVTRYGTIRPSGAAFIVDEDVYANAREASAEVFTRFALEPETLDRQRRRWVERTAERFGLAWLRLAQDMRSSGATSVPSDYASVYHCGDCGHRWGEMPAAAD